METSDQHAGKTIDFPVLQVRKLRIAAGSGENWNPAPCSLELMPQPPGCTASLEVSSALSAHGDARALRIWLRVSVMVQTSWVPFLILPLISAVTQFPIP
jgi:hypothetical protein